MTLTDDLAADLSLRVDQAVDIKATVEEAFDALLEQLGPGNETPDGTSLAMRLEPWPGGRWYRDLGDDNGHLWGHVQVIKRPTLLEITGPLFMSDPVVSHIRYRLAPQESGCRLTLVHRAFGLVEPEHRAGVRLGWAALLECVRRRADED